MSTESETQAEEGLPATLPSEIYIVSTTNLKHGGRSEWQGTIGGYRFTRGGVYRINHPIDIAYFMGSNISGIEVYLGQPDGVTFSEADKKKNPKLTLGVDYSYPSDKIDIAANRGAGKGSILAEAQKRYERSL